MGAKLFSKWNDILTTKVVLALTDVISITVAYYASYHIRNYVFWMRGGIYVANPVHAIFLLGLLTIVIFVFRHNLLYRELGFSPTSRHLSVLTRTWFVLILVFITLSFFFRVQLFIEHRITVALFASMGWTFLYVSRFFVVPHLAHWIIGTREYTHRVVILGTDDNSYELADEIYDFTHSHNRLIGVVAREAALSPGTVFGVPRLGSIADLQRLVSEQHIHEVFIGPALLDHNDLAHVLEQLRSSRIRIRVSVSHFGSLREKARHLVQDGQNLIVLNEGSFLWVDRFLKRSLDLVGSLVGIVLALPLLGLIAVLIKLDSRGPVIFRQKRGGLDGREFDVFKFRTMGENTESYHKGSVEKLMNADVAYFKKETGKRDVFKTVNDAQITRVGRILRKYSLDELPQLVNVLRGEMSLVGPRPEPQYQVALYQPWHRLRLLVKPGITGFWQVYGRSSVSHDDMVLMDIYYICNWSFSLDMKILFETPFTLLTGKGAV